MSSSSLSDKRVLIIAVVAVLALLGWYGWSQYLDQGPGEGFISGNGRIEATEIDIATKLPGRIEEILVREGDFVSAGQVLARMQIDTLEAQREEALAAYQEAVHGVAAANAQISLRESDVTALQAVVVQREAELYAAQRRLVRTETLARDGAISQQEFDDDQARARSVRAAVSAAKAQVLAAQAAVTAAKAQQTGAESRVRAMQATINRIDADLADSELKAPRAGRVQVRVAQPGEVLGAGGRVLNLLDLADVYMTFFVPEVAAGRLALGSEVRLVLDTAPDYVVPARVSFVASQAQFTPKTVETASERQKLMFRVRAQIPPQLLQKYLEQVKTGVPGVAWIKLDAEADWPDFLAIPEALNLSHATDH
ncbi:HlyD family secretion protein [Pseudomonas sp. MYb185]|uniref:HlyD family secretion protein n=1 Tax=Pseudomonas sp. MYb185 TaxID=1848729 RepID=UPI000CFE2A00|nr:efflux RND transporter periplasmic adaptor subunit [Pseudomonas sp. MYb185]PRB82001.1 hemolysin D [Pseudomonas sp. MYb185]